MSEEAGSPVVTPVPIALVVCDAVWRDPYTLKCTIIGTFSTITAGQYPAQHPIISTYAAVTGGRGRTPIRIVICDASEEQVTIAEQAVEIDFVDPRMVVELQSAFGNIVFPHAGEYWVQLYASNELLLERRLLLLTTSEGGEHAGDPNDTAE